MDNDKNKTIRADHRVIMELVEDNSRVLDLGCGDGDLLALLIHHKSCHGTGIEISERAIYGCVEKGLSVSHGDIDSGLLDYSSDRFDYVILNESLQQVFGPEKVILEALRVGKKVVVGIPNFCHWSSRLQIFFGGKVPVTPELPYEWYNTPNVRSLGIKDFRDFCKEKGIAIRKERHLSGGTEVRCCPNLFSRIGIFLLEKKDKRAG